MDIIFTKSSNLLEIIQLRTFLETSNSIQALKEQFGEPNAEAIQNTTYIYELEKEDGEERYLDFLVSVDGDIVKVSVGNKEDYLDVLWKKNNLMQWSLNGKFNSVISRILMYIVVEELDESIRFFG